MSKLNRLFIGLLMLVCIILLGINIQMKEENVRNRYQDSLLIPPPIDPSIPTRGYNYKTGGWRNYSDEEIRIMREKHSYRSDGSYIHTPGRRVKTREEEIEDYIDDNIEDIMNEYR